jgi:hypothetical protein
MTAPTISALQDGKLGCLSELLPAFRTRLVVAAHGLDAVLPVELVDMVLVCLISITPCYGLDAVKTITRWHDTLSDLFNYTDLVGSAVLQHVVPCFDYLPNGWDLITASADEEELTTLFATTFATTQFNVNATMMLNEALDVQIHYSFGCIADRECKRLYGCDVENQWTFYKSIQGRRYDFDNIVVPREALRFAKVEKMAALSGVKLVVVEQMHDVWGYTKDCAREAKQAALVAARTRRN